MLIDSIIHSFLVAWIRAYTLNMYQFYVTTLFSKAVAPEEVFIIDYGLLKIICMALNNYYDTHALTLSNALHDY